MTSGAKKFKGLGYLAVPPVTAPVIIDMRKRHRLADDLYEPRVMREEPFGRGTGKTGRSIPF